MSIYYTEEGKVPKCCGNCALGELKGFFIRWPEDVKAEGNEPFRCPATGKAVLTGDKPCPAFEMKCCGNCSNALGHDPRPRHDGYMGDEVIFCRDMGDVVETGFDNRADEGCWEQ